MSKELYSTDNFKLFLQKKAGYIKRVSQILLEKYGGDIPATMDQLVSLHT